MVNNGASRACHACKQRHKKCDETRPSCLRCSRARRTCPGYTVSKELKFVNYSGGDVADCNQLHQWSSVNHAKGGWSAELQSFDWPRIEEDARLAFFADYCIVSPNQDISRGYLSGLQVMVHKAGATSAVTKACTTIALASLGRKLRDHRILHKAQDLHTSLLRSFSLSISNGDTFISVESLITATLLGLYEIIINTDAYNGAHIAHAQGVSAILTSKSSPFDLVCGGHLFKAPGLPLADDQEVDSSKLPSWQHTPPDSNRVGSRFSILCTPLSKHSVTTIDEIFARTEPLVNRATAVLAGEATLDQLNHVKRDAETLKNDYNAWQGELPEEWKPKAAGIIASLDAETTPHVGYWPGTVTSYHDSYIAAIWNSYRKARLLVINVIMDCYHRICTFPDHEEIDPSIYGEIEELTEGTLSSIPFILSADLQTFLDKSTTRTPLIPGRPVGGLLLMHTLYINSVLPIINSRAQVYFRECLAWVGDTMGIGQATILSKCTTSDLFDYVTEAHVLIWAGMLI